MIATDTLTSVRTPVLPDTATVELMPVVLLSGIASGTLSDVCVVVVLVGGGGGGVPPAARTAARALTFP